MSHNVLRFSNHYHHYKKPVRDVFWIHALDSFVNALFGIFVPIYLLILGYSVSNVLGFYIVKFVALAVFFYVAGFISSRLGLKHTMIIRLPFFMIFLLSMYFLDTLSISIFIIALLNAFYESLYWMPLHSLFVRSASEDHMGSDVGKLHSLPKLASTVAPLIGGAISVFIGFHALFIVAMVLLVFSIFPLIKSKETKPHVDFSLKEMNHIVKKNPKYFFGTGAFFIGEATENVIWPIFVFLILDSILSIGLIGTLLSAGMVLFTLLVGRLSDRFNKKMFIRMGAGLMVLVFFFRYFVPTEASIYLLTIMAGFFSILLFVPFDSIIYSLAKKSNIDEFIIIRETYVNTGRVFLLFIALILVQNINISFLLASFAHIFFLFF